MAAFFVTMAVAAGRDPQVSTVQEVRGERRCRLTDQSGAFGGVR